METILTIGGMLVGIGSVYGLIRADLKHLHEKYSTHEISIKELATKAEKIDTRINDHIEHHHLRKT